VPLPRLKVFFCGKLTITGIDNMWKSSVKNVQKSCKKSKKPISFFLFICYSNRVLGEVDL
ncbi:MAG: hypothetical protein LBG93_01165, partial [Treponema sp.]|nr:hypothetical protein [Treponema sp.]